MAKKVINIIYNFVRKRLAEQSNKGIVTTLPKSDQIKQGMQEVFRTLKSNGINLELADQIIKNEKDLRVTLNRIIQENNRRMAKEGLTNQPAKDAAVKAYEEVMAKVRTGAPLNPSDKAKLEAAGFKPDASKDLFKGFEPKVIEGSKGKTPFTDIVQKEVEGVKLYGDETFDELDFIRKNKRHPRDEKAKGGLIAAVKKLNKKYGKGTIKKAKDMKRPKKAIEKEELEQLFKSFKKKHGFAGGGLAYMLGE